MNKKILALLLTISMTISACSLGGGDADKNEPAADNTAAVSETDSNNTTAEDIDSDVDTSLLIEEEPVEVLPVMENSEDYREAFNSQELSSCDGFKSATEKAECEEVVVIKATIEDAKFFKNYTFCEMVKVEPFRTECEEELKKMGVEKPEPELIVVPQVEAVIAEPLDPELIVVPQMEALIADPTDSELIAIPEMEAVLGDPIEPISEENIEAIKIEKLAR